MWHNQSKIHINISQRPKECNGKKNKVQGETATTIQHKTIENVTDKKLVGENCMVQ
jgi:hypothetical protein